MCFGEFLNFFIIDLCQVLDDILPEFKRQHRLDDEEALKQASSLATFHQNNRLRQKLFFFLGGGGAPVSGVETSCD